MTGVTNEQLAVAKVYAEAMLRLAERQGEMDLLLGELQDITARIEQDAGFARFLASPTVEREARAAALEKLFRGRYSDLCVDSLQVLNRKGRADLVRAVAEAYDLAREDRLGRIRVYVRTAVALTDELRTGIKDVAGRYAQKEADLIETVDGSLIAGLVVRIGDKKFDGSVQAKLARLGAALRERALHEVFGGREHVEGAPA